MISRVIDSRVDIHGQTYRLYIQQVGRTQVLQRSVEYMIVDTCGEFRIELLPKLPGIQIFFESRIHGIAFQFPKMGIIEDEVRYIFYCLDRCCSLILDEPGRLFFALSVWRSGSMSIHIPDSFLYMTQTWSYDSLVC